MLRHETLLEQNGKRLIQLRVRDTSIVLSDIRYIASNKGLEI